MGRSLTETPITTRNARASLPAGIYWRGIDPQVHLGYRKGKRGGVWLVRWRNGTGYQQCGIGTADDKVAIGTLDYHAAIKAARTAVETARQEAIATAEGPVPTVRSAISHYMAARDARDSARKGRPVRSDATTRLERYVVGREPRGNRKGIPPHPLADVPLHRLDEDKLMAWRDSLPAKLKAATCRRLTNDLKAALNAACTKHRKRLPPSLPGIIQSGLRAPASAGSNQQPVARTNQILTDDTISHILAASRVIDGKNHMEGDLFRLILVLAATGARLSQITRLKVGDVQPRKARIMLPASRKGKGSKAATIPVPVGRDVLDALRPIIRDRQAEEILLTRWRYKQVAGTIRWTRAGRGPWTLASELTRLWAAIRAEAGLDKSVVPYALRHSSIVRGIRAGLPIRLVAAMHDTSVTMIERHYGRWIASGLEDMARKALVPLVRA